MNVNNFLRVGAFRFYYAYSRVLNRLLPTIRLDGKSIYVAPRVYKPLENEHRLADTCFAGSRVLDLGCGSGVVAVFAAPVANNIVASDISPAAIKNTQHNCESLGLTNVTCLISDMFERIEGRFDLIVTHPPYFQLNMKGVDAQFATSTTFLEVLFRQGKDYLNQGGSLLVQYPEAQRSRLEDLANRNGLTMVKSESIGSKRCGVLLTSWLYLQFGNKTQRYWFKRS